MFQIISAKSILAHLPRIIWLHLLRLVLRISECHFISFNVLIKTTGTKRRGTESSMKGPRKGETNMMKVSVCRNEKWLLL